MLAGMQHGQPRVALSIPSAVMPERIRMLTKSAVRHLTECAVSIRSQTCKTGRTSCVHAWEEQVMPLQGLALSHSGPNTHGEGVRMRGGDTDIDDDAPVEDPPDLQEYLAQHGIAPLPDEEDEFDVDPNGGLSQWPRERLIQPLFPGSAYTVEQFSYALMRIKTGSIHDDRADQLCKLFKRVMPDGYSGPGCCPNIITCTPRTHILWRLPAWDARHLLEDY